MGVVRYIAGQFGHPTGFFGRAATLLMNRLNRPMYHTCAEILSERYSERILDIGFGNGHMLRKLRRKGIGNRLYGIDISEDMLRMARQRVGDAVGLKVGGVENLEFSDGFFGAAYSINTLYFWNDPDWALSEIRRVLAPGGLFLNFCYTKQWLDKLKYTRYGFAKYTCEELVKLHRKSGFETVELIEIEAGKSFYIHCRK